MNSLSRTLMVALVPSLLALWGADEVKPADKPLPEVITKTRTDNDTKNAKNYQTFKTAWIKNETERLKVLNDALKSSTQKGDFDICLAIKEEIKGVEALIVMLNDPQCKMLSYDFSSTVADGDKGKNGKVDDKLSKFPTGFWKANNGWDVNISLVNGVYVLNMFDMASISSVIDNNILYVNWCNTETFVIEIKNTALIMTQYSVKFSDVATFKEKVKVIQPLRSNIICTKMKIQAK